MFAFLQTHKIYSSNIMIIRIKFTVSFNIKIN